MAVASHPTRKLSILPQLPTLAEPDWLAELTADTMMRQQLPLRKLLADSLFYPYCGLDTKPIQALAGNVLSFEYADAANKLSGALAVRMDGYQLLAGREVQVAEWWPAGWTPLVPLANQHDEPIWFGPRPTPLYCNWAVFERHYDRAAGRGPRRLSVLYLAADGVAAFRSFYSANELAPKAVAIIRSRGGINANGSAHEDPCKALPRRVLEHPHGQPEWVLFGGCGPAVDYPRCCWPGYRRLVGYWGCDEGGVLGVWER
jgi:hypothetical protein